MSGTVSFLDGHSFGNIGSVAVIPDLDQRLAEIAADPVRAYAYELVTRAQILPHFEPANGERFNDDVAVSPNGTRLATYPTPDDYPHNSAHHGLDVSGDGARLCDVGTIDDTVSIVSADHLRVLSTASVGHVPYWAATSVDGDHCLVAVSADNTVTVVSYRTGRVIAVTPVGGFPQRIRLARVPEHVVRALGPSPG